MKTAAAPKSASAATPERGSRIAIGAAVLGGLLGAALLAVAALRLGALGRWRAASQR
jgi:hypothetical protein